MQVACPSSPPVNKHGILSLFLNSYKKFNQPDDSRNNQENQRNKNQSVKDLAQIVLEMVSKLNSMNREKDRLIDIASDGQISEDEYKDFSSIKKQLTEMSMSIEAFRIWVDKTIAEGKIDKSAIE